MNKETVNFIFNENNETNILESSKSTFSYTKVQDINDFKKSFKDVFNCDSGMNDSQIYKDMKAIKADDKIIGYIGFSNYGIQGKKYLGIGNFMIKSEYQNSGYGSDVIKDIINKNKSKYDEIYCYVDKKNTGAIRFYKRVASVDTCKMTKYGYRVTIYKKSDIQESKALNEEDIYYNKDKFDSGEINLCFITGHSGSGKSTMAHGMEGDKIEVYELDDVIANYNFSDSNLKEYGDLIYSFFKGPGKKFRYTSKKEWREDKQWHNRDPYVDGYDVSATRAFVKYAIQYAKAHKDTKFVIDGVWLLLYINPSDLDPYAVYIKGTSMLISKIRAAKRDSEFASSKFDRAKAFTKQLTTNFKLYMIVEKKINEYHSHFKSKIKK